MYINDADKVVTPDHQYAYSSHDDVIIKIYIVKLDYLGLFTLYNQCLKYINHTPTAKRLVCGCVLPRSDLASEAR